MQEYSFFVTQIEDAMRPLIGVIADSEVIRFGFHQADEIYDRLVKNWNWNTGVPQPGSVSKGQAIAEAFAIAWKKLQKTRFHVSLDMAELEKADFLLAEGYKDPAAVMGGDVLERHLRQLCMKYSIEVETSSGSQKVMKKADRLNNDLVEVEAYTKLDQKSIVQWLDLRNKAAHSEYVKYTNEQVALMLAGIRDFIARYPV